MAVGFFHARQCVEAFGFRAWALNPRRHFLERETSFFGSCHGELSHNLQCWGPSAAGLLFSPLACNLCQKLNSCMVDCFNRGTPIQTHKYVYSL